MKSVVILGASGYIGSYLTRKLSKKFKLRILVHRRGEARHFRGSRNVRVFSGDILTRGDLEKLIRKGDVVVNLSGTTTVAQVERDHFDVNVTGQYVVAEVCAQKGARVIYFSTAHMYGSGRNASKESDPVHPRDVYSLSKKMAEEVYEFFARVHDLPTVIFRLGSVYGPGHKKGVVYTMAHSIKKRGVIEIPRGAIIRDFIYVDDVVRAVEKAIRFRKSGCTIFNISSGEGQSLARVAEMICAIAHTGVIARVDTKPRTATIRVSIAKAKKELMFKPLVALESGLRRTLASYKLSL